MQLAYRLPEMRDNVLFVYGLAADDFEALVADVLGPYSCFSESGVIVQSFLGRGNSGAIVAEVRSDCGVATFNCIVRIVGSDGAEKEYSNRWYFESCFPVIDDLILFPLAVSNIERAGRRSVLYAHAKREEGQDDEFYSLHDLIAGSVATLPELLIGFGSRWHLVVRAALERPVPGRLTDEIHNRLAAKAGRLDTIRLRSDSELLTFAEYAALSPVRRLIPDWIVEPGNRTARLAQRAGSDYSVHPCLSHGDLHADNVLVALRGPSRRFFSYSVIDIEHMKSGADAFLDLATLEIDVIKKFHLSSCADFYDHASLAARIALFLSLLERCSDALRPKVASRSSIPGGEFNSLLSRFVRAETKTLSGLRRRDLLCLRSVLGLRLSYTRGLYDADQYRKTLALTYLSSLRFLASRTNPFSPSSTFELLFFSTGADCYSRGTATPSVAEPLLASEDALDRLLASAAPSDGAFADAARLKAALAADLDPEAERIWAEALVDAGRLDAWPHAKALTTVALFDKRRRLGRVDERVETGRLSALVEAIARDTDETTEEGRLCKAVALHCLGVQSLNEDNGNGWARLHRAFELFKTLPFQKEKARFLNTMGHYSQFRCDYGAALVYLEEAEYLKKRFDPESLAFTYGSLGSLHRKLRDHREALAYYGKDLRRERSPDVRNKIRLNMAETMLDRLNWLFFFAKLPIANHPWMKRVRGILSRCPRGEPFYFKVLARYRLLSAGLFGADRNGTGDCGGVDENAKLGKTLAWLERRRGSVERSAYLKAYYCRYTGRLRALLGAWDGAEADADESVRLFEGAGMPIEAASSFLDLAFASYGRGEHDATLRRLEAWKSRLEGTRVVLLLPLRLKHGAASLIQEVLTTASTSGSKAAFYRRCRRLQAVLEY